MNRAFTADGAALFAEYSDVINREDIFKACYLSKDERNELLDIFLGFHRWTDKACINVPGVNVQRDARRDAIDINTQPGVRDLKPERCRGKQAQ